MEVGEVLSIWYIHGMQHYRIICLMCVMKFGRGRGSSGGRAWGSYSTDATRITSPCTNIMCMGCQQEMIMERATSTPAPVDGAGQELGEKAAGKKEAGAPAIMDGDH